MDETALVKTCLESRVELTPRLVYADWLDEQGTERCHARAEWIRLTCSSVRKSISVRQTGERNWIEKNAHRIWPNVVSMVAGRLTDLDDKNILHFGNFQMPAQQVRFRVPVVRHSGKSGAATRVVTTHRWVAINVDRGVTRRVYIPFDSVSTLAKVVAKDEPGRDFETNIPEFAIDNNQAYRVVRLSPAPFKSKRLLDVWEGIPHRDTDPRGWSDKVRVNDGHTHLSWPCDAWQGDALHIDMTNKIIGLVDESLTRWVHGINGGAA